MEYLAFRNLVDVSYTEAEVKVLAEEVGVASLSLPPSSAFSTCSRLLSSLSLTSVWCGKY